MMKSKKLLSLFISIVVGAAVFAASGYATKPADTKTTETSNPQIQKDGEIVATLIVINKNEIAAANSALKKETNPAVKAYAKMLKHQHMQNLDKLLKLSKKTGIAPVKTAAVFTLQQDGTKELAALSTLKGKDFEKAYIDAMIKGHTAVLQTMDNNLLKNVSNPSLKKFLLATRPHIEAHLHQAQTIQKELD